MNRQKFQLLVKKGPQAGKVYPLDSVSIIIGRDPMVDISITDPEVSRQHAQLNQTSSGYSIHDLGSTNGTYIDDQRLSGEPVELNSGQTITMGAGVSLLFQEARDYSVEKDTVLDFSLLEEDSHISGEPDESKGVFFDPDQDEDVRENAPAAKDDDMLQEMDEQDDADTPLLEGQPQSDEPKYKFEGVRIPGEGNSAGNEKGSGQPVVIPHQGQGSLEEQQDGKGAFRMPAVIIAVLLLILCCCCSVILFIYYYGGDWMLRQLGLLP